MKFNTTNLTGCYLIDTGVFHDQRGSFTKIYNEKEFLKNGISAVFKEQFFTISNKNVLRGMHYQEPPHDHCKLVSCFSGAVLDVVLDLRKSSATYGESQSFELSADNMAVLFIPIGIAHGFLSLEDNSGMMYSVSTEYAEESDSGVHWNSFGFNWPVKQPIVSERDMLHSKLEEIDNPF